MLYLFTTSLFVSSTLLFLIQPMFGKMVLPLMGGSPTVWNTCMLFYQSALLAGYSYAHWISSKLRMRYQTVLHLVLLSSAVIFLPIQVRNFVPLQTNNPAIVLFLSLIFSVGLPFFAISANGVLIQKWFTNTAHPMAKDPYFLYRASNLGSILALLAYPLFVETNLRLVNQSRAWSIGYIFLIFLILACAIQILRGNRVASSANLPGDLEHPSSAPISHYRKARWLLLSFVPSSLMLGVTTYLSTDISPFPLLWIVPLVIYLLTFVIAFARKPVPPHSFMLRIEPIIIVPLVLLMVTQATRPVWLVFSFHLLALFVVAMVCHGELAQSRPEPEKLTEFYLWLSVGGALGGLFNAFVGPLLFNSIVEYPVTIILACALRMGVSPDFKKMSINMADFILPAALGAATLTLLFILKNSGFFPEEISLKPFMALPAVICFIFSNRPLRFALAIGALMLAGSIYNVRETGRSLYAERSFFGLHRVILDPEKKFHWLVHGVTVHGGQILNPFHSNEPLAYYHREGPIGQFFTAFSKNNRMKRIAIVGLGTGSMAYYASPDAQLTFYEIDPAVKKIAENPQYFTFLKECKAPYKIVIGDARLSFNKLDDRHPYDLIVLDAFGSDAIPLHLLTREAMQLYLSKLAGNGILAFHITNRYLDLQPVLADLAGNAGLAAFYQEDISNYDEINNGKFSSRWVIMARNESDLGPLARDSRWELLKPEEGRKAWSDDFSNILEVFSWD